MSQDAMGTPCLGDSTYTTSLSKDTACSTLLNETLAAQCLRELGNYRGGESYNESYGLELLQRATLEGDTEAWEWVQHCFRDMVLGWLRRHPSRVAALRFLSEENYIALTFCRFWQAITSTQKVEFRTLAAALQYLRVSLNGAILDTLRANSRPKEVPLPEPGELEKSYGGDQADSREAWGILESMLPDRREWRLAYLLYHCGLKPREIVHFCPQEWSDVQEIYRLRRNIMNRLLRKRDQFCW